MKDKIYFDDLLGRNKIEPLLLELLEVLRLKNQDDLHGNILLLLTRFRRNEEKARQNIISENEYNIESNKIINSIKDYLKEFESYRLSWRDKENHTMISQSERVTIKSKVENMTLNSKLDLIYKELSLRLERRAQLEGLLSHLQIPYHHNDIKEFEDEFNKSGFVRVIAKSKDGIEIFLTQKGLDYLKEPQKAQPHQPNIIFENYQNSIINKGENINQVGNFGNKITEKAPVQNPNPNAPSKSIQRWQLIVGIIAVLTAISLALLKSRGLL